MRHAQFMKKRPASFQPKLVDRAHLYACEHCGWLNLVALNHSRIGPRKGYSLEMLRVTGPGVLTNWSNQDRGVRASQPGDVVTDNNGKKWQNGTIYHARCGRPLLQDPQATDLFWPDDARALMNTGRRRDPMSQQMDIYCKSAHFNKPRLLKEDLATAVVSADRLGGQDAVLLMLREALCNLRIGLTNTLFPFSAKYEGWVPVVMPLWVHDGHFETVAKTWGEVKG